MLFESLCTEAANRTKKHFDEVRYDPDYSEDGQVDPEYVGVALLQYTYDLLEEADFGALGKMIEEGAMLSHVRTQLIEALTAEIIEVIDDEVIAYAEGSVQSQDSGVQFKLR